MTELCTSKPVRHTHLHTYSFISYYTSPDNNHLASFDYCNRHVSIYNIENDMKLVWKHTFINYCNIAWKNNDELIMQFVESIENGKTQFIIYSIRTHDTYILCDDINLSLIEFRPHYMNRHEINTDNQQLLIGLVDINKLVVLTQSSNKQYYMTESTVVPIHNVSNIYVKPDTSAIIVSGSSKDFNNICIYSFDYLQEKLIMHANKIIDFDDDYIPYYTMPVPNNREPTHLLILFVSVMQVFEQQKYALLDLTVPVESMADSILFVDLAQTFPNIYLNNPTALDTNTESLNIGYLLTACNTSDPEHPTLCLFDIVSQSIHKELGCSYKYKLVPGSPYVVSNAGYKKNEYREITASGLTNTISLYNQFDRPRWVLKLKNTNIIAMGEGIKCIITQRTPAQCIKKNRGPLYELLADMLCPELIEQVLSYSWI
jgi:hypothetical protein